MIYLRRKERRGERSRARISTPRESVRPEYRDGLVYVACSQEATARILERRHGFARYDSTDTPAASDDAGATDGGGGDTVQTRADELKAMTVRELRKIAADLKIKGRSKMGEDDLIAAIVDAEA